MTVAAGRGAAPETVPAPLTTRMWEGPVPFPMTADGARAFLNEWWDAWRRGLLAAGEDALWAPIGSGTSVDAVGPVRRKPGILSRSRRERWRSGTVTFSIGSSSARGRVSPWCTSTAALPRAELVVMPGVGHLPITLDFTGPANVRNV